SSPVAASGSVRCRSIRCARSRSRSFSCRWPAPARTAPRTASRSRRSSPGDRDGMRLWRDQRGFTLAELLAAFAMLGLVLAAVVMIQDSVFRAYLAGSNKTEGQQTARLALERMSREIRETPTPLTVATPTSVTFVHQDTGLPVTYALNGATQ